MEATTNTEWDQITEDLSFIFYACDRTGRIHFVNRAWYDFASRNDAPDILVRSAVNQNLVELLAKTDNSRFLDHFESIRRGDVFHFEDIVPCHAPNQYRWMLLRMQRLGEEIIFSSYFLRHYLSESPRATTIRCIGDGGNQSHRWNYDPAPIAADDSLALCPNCSLLVYSFLRDRVDNVVAELSS